MSDVHTKRGFDLKGDLLPDEISRPIAFTIDTESEVLLHLKMRSDTDWAEIDKESAVLTLFVDGNYSDQNQDIVLFNGTEIFIYRVSLGRLRRGEHTIEFKFDIKKSSSNATKIHLEEMNLSQITLEDDNYDAFRFSPILYGRDDNYLTDVPLLMYYELKQDKYYKTIDYTIIWSNEDGGTDLPGLMSRWGRTTDIELTYRVKLDQHSRIIDDYFHGVGHDTLRFRGDRVNDHPILRTSTLNNQVSDSGKTDYKFFLAPELSKGKDYSRELLMDLNPWTYKLMAKEMVREGKYEVPADPSTVMVSEARNYLYFEFYSSMQGSELRLSFGVKLRDDSTWYYSDHRDTAVQAVDRAGWRRTTIELPVGAKLDDLQMLQFTGEGKTPFSIRLVAISKIFMLSEEYVPEEFPLSWRQEVVLNESKRTVIFSFNELNTRVSKVSSNSMK